MREGAELWLLLHQNRTKTRRPNTIIIISNYTIEFKEDKNVGNVISAEFLPCPTCGGSMVVHDTRERGVFRYEGDKEIYRLRRLSCRVCGKLHTELPDFILPFKHYDAQTIQATLEESPDNSCAADESTMARWRRSFARAQEAIAALLVSYYMRLTENSASLFDAENIMARIKAGQKHWLSFVMRLLINSGHRPHTCFAFCP